MKDIPSDIAFTASVKAEQVKRGSRDQFARMEMDNGWPATITAGLAEFLAGVRSCYLASANAQGQPYIQHRGGPPGFLKPLDEKTIGFADFSGNRQYITTGNLAENARAFLFVMDYRNRRRVKIWGTARVVENDEALLSSLMSGSYVATPERAILFTVEAWDRNCPQHIPQLFSLDDVKAAVAGYAARVAELEAELARLRSGQ